ncbi:DNA helicase [Actinorhabdospora filicis]|uniref:DNA 3'-5' helicase n=1 Tax=Actinorhabdospora filicis TaxID=1785913 RepID=A0A9W6WEL2_9ACTN|nr:DNA helicase [Actinorhabdospora filicis]
MTGNRVEQVLAGLDDEQRAAVSAPAGPVCILAGAGTGKTRAVTHRIAYRVAKGDVRPQHVLAVTFTQRAAGELRDRLRPLGADGAQARTFHSAALRQLRYFSSRLLGSREVPELMDSKAKFVGIAAARLGLAFSRTKLRDIAGEIEWAKSSLVEPDTYQAMALRAGRDIPGDAAEVAKIYTAYEEGKQRAGVIDFEDMLLYTARGIEEHDDIAQQIRAQYRLFVVDEYQDVNPLQQRLLDAWLGDRDDLTVVGDAAQTIYSFTGATADYLLDFTRVHREATVVRLVRDYRSTPQIVGLANETIGAATGAQARLRLKLIGQRPDGPPPQTLTFDDEHAEAAAVAARCAELIARGVPAGQIAVLFRANAQSEAYEAALSDAGVPTVVQGAARFFDRPEVRQAVVALRAATRTAPAEGLVDTVTEALEAVGWRPQGAPGGGQAREKWEAVAALVRLAEEHAHLDLPGFVDELARRAAVQHVPTVDGVTLASLHAAKGLEWDAVFLVGLVEGTLPTTYARTSAQVEEERRLLYVGITRARHSLWLSWSLSRLPGGRPRRPCRFLAERLAGDRPELAKPPAAKPGKKAPKSGPIICRICGKTLIDAEARKLGRCVDCPSNIDEELYERLVEWRLAVARATALPAYTVFTNATLTAIAELRPEEISSLAKIAGVGPSKITKYGEAVLALVGGASVDDLSAEQMNSATTS